MSEHILNGHEIPYHLPLEELEKMLNSGDMTDFALACEALTGSKAKENYSLMKRYLDHPDKYRRRYVWSRIFEFPHATELIDRFSENFYSDDSIFVTMAFNVAVEYSVPVSETVLWDAIDRHEKIMYANHYLLLMNLERNASNYEKIVELYERNQNSRSVREELSLVLERYVTDDRFNSIYELFERDEYAKIRIVACRIAYEKKRDDLLVKFQNDTDGHVRKAAERYLDMLRDNVF